MDVQLDAFVTSAVDEGEPSATRSGRFVPDTHAGPGVVAVTNILLYWNSFPDRPTLTSYTELGC